MVLQKNVHLATRVEANRLRDSYFHKFDFNGIILFCKVIESVLIINYKKRFKLLKLLKKIVENTQNIGFCL